MCIYIYIYMYIYIYVYIYIHMQRFTNPGCQWRLPDSHRGQVGRGHGHTGTFAEGSRPALWPTPNRSREKKRRATLVEAMKPGMATTSALDLLVCRCPAECKQLRHANDYWHKSTVFLATGEIDACLNRMPAA